jgi:hypothetical protein
VILRGSLKAIYLIALRNLLRLHITNAIEKSIWIHYSGSDKGMSVYSQGGVKLNLLALRP